MRNKKMNNKRSKTGVKQINPLKCKNKNVKLITLFNLSKNKMKTGKNREQINLN